MLSRAQFAESLKSMGIQDGDVLYIRASLGALGKVDGDLSDVVLGGFQDAVGPQGTLLAPAFTKIGTVFSKQKTVFDENSAPYSGAISKIFLRDPRRLRSAHPSHSFAAIGPRAQDLLAGHGPQSSCFQPVKKLAEMDGKMILIGCNDESPGFSTVHVAQFDLGLSQKHLVRHLQRAWLRDPQGELKEWRPLESPGCSFSFDKFYPAYIKDRNLRTGFLGRAYSLLVTSTKQALVRDTEILAQDPTFVDCGRASCLTCGFRGYQLSRLPRTFVAAVYERLLRRREALA